MATGFIFRQISSPKKGKKKHEKRISLLRLMRMINYALKANPALKITCAKNIVIRIL